MIESQVDRTLIEYIVECVEEVVYCALDDDSPTATSSSSTSFSPRGRTSSRHSERKRLTKFVTEVLRNSGMKVSSILGALVYITRAKSNLYIAPDARQWMYERVFLGALIVANKYLNDSTLKNIHWSACSRVFPIADIGRIEREFLEVLNFRLGITEEEVMSHHDAIASLMRSRSLLHPHHHTDATTRHTPSSRSKPSLASNCGTLSSDDSLIYESDEETSSKVAIRRRPSISSFITSVTSKRTRRERREVDDLEYRRRYNISPQPLPNNTYLDAGIITTTSHQRRHGPRDRQQGSSNRVSSALSMLRTLSIPRFTHSPSPFTSSLSPSASSSSSSSSSASPQTPTSESDLAVSTSISPHPSSSPYIYSAARHRMGMDKGPRPSVTHLVMPTPGSWSPPSAPVPVVTITAAVS